jgi:putative ABC transport system ATP-binding protein
MSLAAGVTDNTLVKLDHVSKSYQSGEVLTEVLRDVNLVIDKNEFLVVLGVSGCGKTTLLNLIGALDAPSSGSIVVDGQPISAMDQRMCTEFRRRKVGFIFQFYNLLPTLSAVENVEAALEILPLSPSEIRARADGYLKAVGLAEKADKFPSQLSGGEQQRVAIARALAKEPILILADEPTGNLDEETGLSVMRLMSDLHRANKTSLIVATHNPRMTAFADRVVRIEHGRIVEVSQLAGVSK